MSSFLGRLSLLACLALGLTPPLSGQPPSARADDKPEKGKRARTDRHGDPLPPGAIARFGTLRWRAEDRVLLLACSPDGKTLLSVGPTSVQLWEVATGKQLRRVNYPKKGIDRRLREVFSQEVSHCVALSPDRKTVAVRLDGKTVLLLDAATGKELRTVSSKGVLA